MVRFGAQCKSPGQGEPKVGLAYPVLRSIRQAWYRMPSTAPTMMPASATNEPAASVDMPDKP